MNELLKDLEKLSNQQEEVLRSESNKIFLDATEHVFYFSNDTNFSQSITYIESIPSKRSKDKIKVALWVGEGNLLSCLPELSKHVDLVVTLDIEEKVLEHAEFMYQLMKDNETCREFSLSYLNNNILVKKEYKVIMRNEENKNKFSVPVNKEIAVKMLLINCEMLGEKHFIESDQRYLKCRAALRKIHLSFIKLDLLDSKSVVTFKSILAKNNVEIAIINITNLQDYDANYAARSFLECKQMWVPTGKLSNSLEILGTPSQASPIILYSRLDKKCDYKKLTSCQAASVTTYIKKIQEYAREINIFSHKLIAKGQYGALFQAAKLTGKVRQVLQEEIKEFRADQAGLKI